MSKGYAYIISDETRPYLLIGCTTRIPEQRVRELDATGFPGQFELVDSILVHDCEMVEAKIHRLLAKHRHNSEMNLFDIAQQDATAYLRTFSRHSKAKHLIKQRREEIDRDIANIEFPSLSRFVSKLRELLSDLFKKYKEELPDTVSTVGPILYKSFCSSSDILAEHSDTPVAISLNCDNMEAWSIGIGEYRFIFDGRKVDPKLAERFQAEGERVFGIFTELGRLNGLIGSKSKMNAIAALDGYTTRAEEILSSISHSPASSSRNEIREYAFRGIDCPGRRKMGDLRDRLTGMLHLINEPQAPVLTSEKRTDEELTDEEKAELVALKKAFGTMTDLQAVQESRKVKKSNPDVARRLKLYSQLLSKNHQHNVAISKREQIAISQMKSYQDQIKSYQDRLTAIDRIDALEDEILKPVLTTLCEMLDLARETQEIYLSYSDGVDSLIGIAREMLVRISSVNYRRERLE